MNHEIDVLLINPGGNRKANYQQLSEEGLPAREPPVWCAMMATFLRLKGLRVDLIDAAALDQTPEETACLVTEIRPGLTALVAYGHHPSASTQVMPGLRALCGAIKKLSPELKIILAGGHVHVAALPERSLDEEAADFVCDGEGPNTLFELASALKAGEKDLTKVRGLLFRQAGRLCRTSPAPNVADLDSEMPGPAWDLLPMDRYRAHNWHCFGGLDRGAYASLYSSLGCPYKCGFCCIQAPFSRGQTESGRGRYRLWSPASVLAQIDLLAAEYGLRNLKFGDELFVCDKKHVLEICDGLIERDYGLNIWCYTRLDTWDEEMLDRMKASGINWAAPGIESGNARVREDVHKGFTSEKIIKAVEAFRKAGLNIGGNYIFGLPEDDLASLRETLDLALELKCEWANFYCVMAYPGSELWIRANEAGWPLPGDWSGYAQPRL